MPQTEPRYALLLRALPDRTPAEIRLRHVLKALLRTYRFRCQAVQELPADDPVILRLPRKAGT